MKMHTLRQRLTGEGRSVPKRHTFRNVLRLWHKDCRRIAGSLVYLLFLAVLVYSWSRNFRGITADEISRAAGNHSGTGFGENTFDRPLLAEPSETDLFYGSKTVEDPEKIMCGMADILLMEYRNNIYTTYPFGYYKGVSLDEKEQEQIQEILCELTGLTGEQLENLPEDYFPIRNGPIFHSGSYEENSSGEIVIRAKDGGNQREITEERGESDAGPDERETGGSENTVDKTKHFVPQVSYERFQELREEARQITNDGYYYSMETLLEYFGQGDMTYEDACREYSRMLSKDRITGGFARLFCDYMGLTLGFYPVFLMVFLWQQETSGNAAELIYSRRISSLKLVLSRYLAGVSMTLLPVILLSFESLIPLMAFGKRQGISVDCFAYVKYSFWWLLPTVMAVSAAGTFFTVLTDSPIAVLIQFLWWMISKGVTGLSGDTTWTTLMIRHNTLRGYEWIQENFWKICANRLLMTGISMALVVLSAWILEQKRRGKFRGAALRKMASHFKD